MTPTTCPLCGPAHPMEHDGDHDDFACPECGLAAPREVVQRIAQIRRNHAKLEAASAGLLGDIVKRHTEITEAAGLVRAEDSAPLYRTHAQLVDDVAVLRAERDELQAEVARLKYDLCEVCAGSGKLLTDEPCGICKGTGDGHEEKVGLRLECHRLSRPAHVLAEAADEWRRRCPCACRECEALATAYAKLSGGRDAG